ncbi:hypothetical protein AB4371_21655 [Vibrio sp. 10N.261.51.A3]|uniref:hypothetical protein n=1 Tax=Vibrio sp. 10N.261.51.A3 TaxID=3229673 RepID=UPI003552E625
MNFWRMQLHPDDSENAVAHTVKSLGLGYIGLDFANPPGDLTDVDAADIPKSQRDYWDFAHRMKVGDFVLIVAHHYPCALVEIIGEYNYIRKPECDLGVWFRHFRKVKPVGFYSDFVTNPANWQKTIMTDTISILNSTDSISYKLMQQWRQQMCL